VKWGEPRFVRLSQLKLPPDFEARLKMAHVRALAETFEDTGGSPIDLPVVRMDFKPWELLSGGDRCAALVLVGRADRILVRPVECTNLEARFLRAIPNAHRRQDRDQWLAELVGAKSEQAEERRLVAEEKQRAKSGSNSLLLPTRQTKAEIHAEVARETGTTPAAVKQAEHRARQHARTRVLGW